MSNARSFTVPKGLTTTAAIALAAGGVAWAASPMLPQSPLVAHAAPSTIAAHPAAWQGGTSIADIVEQAEPAVVTITVEQEAQPVDFRGQSQFGEDDGPFGEMLRQFMGRGGMQQQQPEEHGSALGSGFLIDGDGNILTNNHVVDHGTRFTVEFSDKTIAQATLVGTDPESDLALIHVDRPPSVAPLSFADSEKLRIGDPVIAIGDPFGVGQTVTSGVVSARGRSLGNSSYVDYIQTDASINQGNSGGPLLDYSGQVVGVNSAIFSPSGGNVGIGFAVPSNIASQIVQELKSQGKVRRAWLGAGIQDVTPQIASAAGLAKAEGAIVAQVDDHGPSAGKLKPGDIVLAFDGKPIREARDLSMAASHSKIGGDATISLLRQGSRQDVKVHMAELAHKNGADDDTPDGLGGPAATAAPRLGLTVTPLDDALRDRLGLADGARGTVVTGIDDDGAAARVGIRPGDVIERVGDAPVSDANSLAHALEGARNDTALLLLNRGGQRTFLAVPLG